MTDFLTYVDRIIDHLVITLPLGTLDNFPSLEMLLENSHGRYIFLGIVLVLFILATLVVMWIVQKLLTPKQSRSSRIVRNSRANAVSNQQSARERFLDQDCGRFLFLRKSDGIRSSDDTVALMAIEQEMLAVRQLFADGHIIQEVYVTETRRLYGKAKTLQS